MEKIKLYVNDLDIGKCSIAEVLCLVQEFNETDEDNAEDEESVTEVVEGSLQKKLFGDYASQKV